MKVRLLISLLLINFAVKLSFSQKKLDLNSLRQNRSLNSNIINNDSINQKEKNIKLSGKTKYTDYKIISHKGDTTIIDTTLTIFKDYILNFRRRDNFELLAFHNQGQTFNNLGYNFNNSTIFPDIGRGAKQLNYLETEDIQYYHVPTPTTQISYRTGIEQGQVLDAIFTLNFSKRFNVSIAYRGLRSLGSYRRSLSSTGNFRTTVSYKSPKNQYSLKAHVASQDFFNEESGGLTTSALQSFINEDPNFSERGRLDVNLENTENTLDGIRYYFEHDYKLFSSKDSTNQKDFSNLKVGHILTQEKKTYNFSQNAIDTNFFGTSSSTGSVNETVENKITSNQLHLDFNSKYVLGKFRVKANYTNYEYGYDTILNSNTRTIDRTKLAGNAISFGAEWNAKIGEFQLNANASLTPGSARLSGNNLYGEALYKKDSVFTLKANLSINSKSPNFNFLLHQSTYDNYNWQNNFENINTQNIGFVFDSKWGNASVDFTNIDNYTFFNQNNLPTQSNESITYLKLKAHKEFNFWKFGFDNTVMYQNVSSGSNVFRVPEFVTRNTFYYKDNWFKGNPMLVNIGITFKYFTKYKANAYNPLLAEFTLQDTDEIGFPTFDVFFNARVRRTRIFFKLENVTSSFTSKNYFSAPNYPYRDMSIRFGLVWNWFI